ncbi:MAG: nucleoid-associated protein [Bacteroidota bacterium]
MYLHYLIVHQLRKEAGDTQMELRLSQKTLVLDQAATELITRLDQLFERKNDILQGYLAEPDEALFPGLYQSWLDDGRQKEAFIRFSQDSMRALAQLLTSVSGAKGGYMLFADYTLEEERRIGIFLIREQDGLMFGQAVEDHDQKFSLEAVRYLDLDHLAMAGRIFSGAGRNVQLIRHARTQTQISQYFGDWLGLMKAESSTELTYNFMEAVRELPLPKDPESGFAMEEADFNKALMQYANKQPQQTIRVDDFDQFFYGDEKPLRAYLSEQSEDEFDDGFRADRSLLRKAFYLRASDQGVSISLNKEHLRQNVVEIDEEAGRITIHSPQLADLLKGQL